MHISVYTDAFNTTGVYKQIPFISSLLQYPAKKSLDFSTEKNQAVNKSLTLISFSDMFLS